MAPTGKDPKLRGLTFNAGTTPAFLLKLQNRIAGVPDEDPNEYGEGGESEFDEFGRERRPPIPTRPPKGEGEGGEEEEEEDDKFADEKPLVVVLKEGKHLSQADVEREKRMAKGLPPLEDNDTPSQFPSDKSKPPKPPTQSLSFSSSSAKGKKPGPTTSSSKLAGKRKVIGDDTSNSNDVKDKAGGKSKKKPKKESKSLVSFGDDA